MAVAAPCRQHTTVDSRQRHIPLTTVRWILAQQAQGCKAGVVCDFSADLTTTQKERSLQHLGTRFDLQRLPTSDADRGPKGKGRLMRVCGLRRLASPTIEGVCRTPGRSLGVATIRVRRSTFPSVFAQHAAPACPGSAIGCPGPPQEISWMRVDGMSLKEL